MGANLPDGEFIAHPLLLTRASAHEWRYLKFPKGRQFHDKSRYELVLQHSSVGISFTCRRDHEAKADQR